MYRTPLIHTAKRVCELGGDRSRYVVTVARMAKLRIAMPPATSSLALTFSALITLTLGTIVFRLFYFFFL